MYKILIGFVVGHQRPTDAFLYGLQARSYTLRHFEHPHDHVGHFRGRSLIQARHRAGSQTGGEDCLACPHSERSDRLAYLDLPKPFPAPLFRPSVIRASFPSRPSKERDPAGPGGKPLFRRCARQEHRTPSVHPSSADSIS